MSGSRFVDGLLLGAVVGAGIVLLCTPNSGSETRQGIRDWIGQAQAEGQRAAELRRMELRAQLEALKQPG